MVGVLNPISATWLAALPRWAQRAIPLISSESGQQYQQQTRDHDHKNEQDDDQVISAHLNDNVVQLHTELRDRTRAHG
jgi:hypothetical protein